MSAKYLFAKGFIVPKEMKDSAQAIGERLKEMEAQQGNIKPEAVVQEAVDSSSPFHPYFMFDDKQCGVKYRLQQAQALIGGIREIRIEIVPRGETPTEEVVLTTNSVSPAPPPIRVFVSVPGTGTYMSVQTAMADPNRRASILREVHSDLDAIAKKLDEFVEAVTIAEKIRGASAEVKALTDLPGQAEPAA
jgi:hypothetical protein